MNLAWVVGAGGLLGSALSRQLRKDGSHVYIPEFRFQWNDPATLNDQLQHAFVQFSDLVRAASSWSIYWAAGVGTMHSDAGALVGETDALRRLVKMVGDSCILQTVVGGFSLASSAGAIYAGSQDPLISELSAPVPTTAYARAKLDQESILHNLSRRSPSMVALAARCSTLYGPGQVIGKKQGLLTTLARHTVRGMPVHIYVPLDTIRDYIDADDAARTVVFMLNEAPRGAMTVKIVAAELPTTVSEIVGIFRRVAMRSPKIITGSGQASAVYARRIQFCSIVRPGLQTKDRISLVVGIARLLEAERARFAAGNR